jgi:hypothetical protein
MQVKLDLIEHQQLVAKTGRSRKLPSYQNHLESYDDYRQYVIEHRQKEKYFSQHVNKITVSKFPEL